jgi:hypothetical protein
MMKTIHDYIAEESQRAAGPVVGDLFAINLREDCLLETHVIDTTDDGFVVAADDLFMSLLENYGCAIEEVARYGPVGSNSTQGYTVAEQDVDKDNSDAELRLIRSRAGVAENDHDDDDDKDPPFDADDEPSSDKDQFGNIIKNKAQHLARKGMQQAKDVKEADTESVDNSSEYDSYGEWQQAARQAGATHFYDFSDDDDLILHDPEGELYGKEVAYTNAEARVKGAPAQTVGRWDWDDMTGSVFQNGLSEAEYQGRKVELNKPMSGDVKKSKVYVKDPKTGNVKKVNFGDPNMRIKKSNPERRKSFRARHNCDNPGPKTKARYWSCRAW